ncbi:MAG TPA: kelch repeat-containing protein [Candidatus Thermoplasmatota archaeon]
MLGRALLPCLVIGLLLSGCLEASGTSNEEVAGKSKRGTAGSFGAVSALPEFPTKLVWKQLADAPTPRAEHAAAVLEGKIYSIGGYLIFNNVDGVALGPGAVVSLDSVEVYDIKTDTWTTGPKYPVTLNHEAAAAHNGYVYVFYGQNSYKLNVAKQVWEPIASVPHGSITAALNPENGTIYVGASNGRVSLYDPATDMYHGLPAVTPGRSHCASGFVNGKFLVGNGDKQGHAITTADLDEFDPDADTWTKRAPNPVVRGSTVGTTWMGRFVVLGGQNQSLAANDPNSKDNVGFGEPSYDDVHAWDPTTDTWTELPDMPHGRHGFGAVTWDDKIYAVAGAPQEGVSGFAELIVLEAQ